MKYQLIILVIILFSTSINSQKKEFQNCFGKTNTENLNLLISDFELNILKKKYPELDVPNAYKSFLSELIENKTELNKNLFKNGEKILEKNNLKFLIYNIIDTVYVGKSLYSESDKEVLIFKYKHLNTKGEFDYMISETSTNDLALKMKIGRKYKEVNLHGLYTKSLEKASSKSNLVKNYLETLNITGSFNSPPVLAYNILNNKIDLNNYFVKIIILTNIIYR